MRACRAAGPRPSRKREVRARRRPSAAVGWEPAWPFFLVLSTALINGESALVSPRAVVVVMISR